MNSKGAAVAALKKAAILDINKGQLDKAIVKLQKILQVCKARGEDEAGKATIPLWAMLGEAYKQQNNLQCAVRVFKHVLEVDANSVMAHIQLMMCYRMMGMFVESLEEVASIRQLECPAKLVPFVTIQAAHTAVLFIKSKETFSEKLDLLVQFIPPLLALRKEQFQSTLLLNTLAEALEVVQNFHGHSFIKTVEDLGLVQYNLRNKVDIARERLDCLKLILEKNPRFADLWNEMGVTFLDMYNCTNDTKHLDSAIQSLQFALQCKSTAQKKSQYWLNLGVIYTKLYEVKKAAHCFIRSTQLDKNNDRSWCALSLLLLKTNQLDDAFTAMQIAQQKNPDLMCTWFAHALHAEATSHYDTMDLFRHTVALQPHPLAVQKFAYYLAKDLTKKKTMVEHTMIDCVKVLGLCDFSPLTPRDRLSIAVVLEQHWFLKEAAHLVQNLAFPLAMKHAKRILLKESLGQFSDVNESRLPKVREAYLSNLEDLLGVASQIPRVQILIESTKAQDANALLQVYTPDMYLLVALIMIVFDIVPSEDFKLALKTRRPLHRLADVYPDGMRNAFELQFQQENDIISGSENNLIAELYELLEKQKEMLQESEVPEVDEGRCVSAES